MQGPLVVIVVGFTLGAITRPATSAIQGSLIGSAESALCEN
ncbi:MAG TPA: hypothetical protein VIK32_11835 [Candidatus Limnocylindrales bacterium]